MQMCRCLYNTCIPREQVARRLLMAGSDPRAMVFGASRHGSTSLDLLCETGLTTTKRKRYATS
jgi:hypothetical protein